MVPENPSSLNNIASEFEKFRSGRPRVGLKYPAALRKRLLKAIDQGSSIDAAMSAAGITGPTLARWRQGQGQKALRRARIPIARETQKPNSAQPQATIRLPCGTSIEIAAEFVGVILSSLREG